MNEIDPSKYQSIINKNKEKTKKHYFKNFLIRVMIVIILFLSLAIVYKSNNKFREYSNKYLFSDNIIFTKAKKFYNKYLGGVLPKIKEENSALVFNEKISYTEKALYYDGIHLTVEKNYLVPSLDHGMVVFVGYKEHYGNTIIIENMDGIDYWYGNISNTSLKLYDYIERGSYIGEVSGDLYLVFSKDEEFLSYEKYLK